MTNPGAGHESVVSANETGGCVARLAAEETEEGRDMPAGRLSPADLPVRDGGDLHAECLSNIPLL